MNTNEPNKDDEERLKLHEVVAVTGLITLVLGGYALAFTMLMTSAYVGDLWKELKKKGG